MFDDAYKSPLSCIIVDDIERLLGLYISILYAMRPLQENLDSLVSDQSVKINEAFG